MVGKYLPVHITPSSTSSFWTASNSYFSCSPSITANLWDVTDKDIDRFTEKLLQSIVPDYEEIQCQKYDVAKAVSFARGACKMRYLVGAAPVVYGFPVFAMSKE